MTPFHITIEITEATQCHAAVSQLLRVFPSLSITITENERIPTPSGPQKAGHADYLHCSCGVCAAIRRDFPNPAREAFRKYLDACTAFAASGYLSAVGADDAGKASVPSYPWKPGEHTEGAADARAKADALHDSDNAQVIDRGDDNADPGYDDTNANGR